MDGNTRQNHFTLTFGEQWFPTLHDAFFFLPMTMEFLLLQRIVPVLRRVTIDQLCQLHYTRETCSHKSYRKQPWVRGNLLRMPGPNQTDFF